MELRKTGYFPVQKGKLGGGCVTKNRVQLANSPQAKCFVSKVMTGVNW